MKGTEIIGALNGASVKLERMPEGHAYVGFYVLAVNHDADMPTTRLLMSRDQVWDFLRDALMGDRDLRDVIASILRDTRA